MRARLVLAVAAEEVVYYPLLTDPMWINHLIEVGDMRVRWVSFWGYATGY